MVADRAGLRVGRPDSVGDTALLGGAEERGERGRVISGTVGGYGGICQLEVAGGFCGVLEIHLSEAQRETTENVGSPINLRVWAGCGGLL